MITLCVLECGIVKAARQDSRNVDNMLSLFGPEPNGELRQVASFL